MEKEKKFAILKAIQEVEADIVTLQNNIEKAKKFLNDIADKLTSEKTEKFDKELDIENGLKHISLH